LGSGFFSGVGGGVRSTEALGCLYTVTAHSILMVSSWRYAGASSSLLFTDHDVPGAGGADELP
jgi:hypothetical protein